MTDANARKSPLVRARWWIALGACAVAVSLLAVGVAQRRAVARALIDAYLRALGLEEIGHVVERFGLAEFGVRDFRIGKRGDLVVDRIDARYSPSSLLAGRLEELSIRGVRLRGTIGEGGVSFGALDPLLHREAEEAGGPAPVFALPAATIEIEDVEVRIETPEGPLAVDFAAHVTDAGAGGLTATATLRARHALVDADATVGLHGTLEELAGDASLALNAAGELAPGTELEPAAVALAARLRYGGEQMEIVVDPAPFALALRRGEEVFRVEGETPGVSLAVPSTGGEPAAAIHVATTGGRVRLPEVGFEARDLVVDLDVQRDSGLPSGSVRIGTLVDPGEAPRLAALALDGTLATDASNVDFDLSLASPGRELVLTARGAHDVATGRGTANVAMEPLTFAADGLQPAALSPVLGALVELASGSIEGRGEVSWGGVEAVRGGLDLAFRDLSVTSEYGSVERLNAAIRLNGPWPLSTPPKQLVSMARVDFGLALTNGLVDFQIGRDGIVEIASARWSLAGGTIRTHGRVDPAAPEQELVLELADIDLAELLVLADISGLSGSGRLAGRVPILRRGSLLEIRGGKLSAGEEGGWIHYRSDTGIASAAGAAARRQGLDVVLAAFENFHYDELVATLDGDATGPVDIAIHIAGANPDYFGGRPVEFNLTIESRLVDLLQKATAIYRVPESIERRLQEMSEASP